MIRWLILMVLLLVLPACAFDIRSTAVDTYREANTRLTDDSLAWICRGVSIREWQARFGWSEESAAAWSTLCSRTEAPAP